MAKIILSFLFLLLLASPIQAADNNFVTPVFPVRSRDYWRQDGDPRHLKSLIEIVNKHNLPVTWLLHYDVLSDNAILPLVTSFPKNQEIGLFLEVTRRLSEDSFVYYHWNTGHWSAADKLYLSGYSLSDRIKLIDHAFNSFKQTLGYYPKSYGAWYVDNFSMEYIKNKYGAIITVGLADQYSTDGYQTWGQYVNQPYYVSNTSAIEPATPNDNLGVIKVLWAPREPTLSYGNSVDSSNFSLQANDYFRGKKLPHSYFRTLFNDLTINTVSKVSQVVVGMEAGELEEQYLPELDRQLDYLSLLSTSKKVIPLTLSEFAKSYVSITNNTTPTAFTTTTKNESTSYWYMSPHYRLGLFKQGSKIILKDLRFYHQSSLKENDQLLPDPNPNLTRLVVPFVDQVSLNNQVSLAQSNNLNVSNDGDVVTLNFADKRLHLYPDRIVFSGFSSFPLSSLPISFSNIDNQYHIIPSPPPNTSDTPCSNDYGNFDSPFPCIKHLLTKLPNVLPDIIYSRLGELHYLGLRLNPTTFFGVTYPRVMIKRQIFDFQTLSNFISLRQNLTPKFSWSGRWEQEIPPTLTDKPLVRKFSPYGQEHILNQATTSKLFENSYYLIYQ